MKVSVNWLREFTDIELSVDDLVTKIGAQLGAVEEVVDLSKKYEGIMVAKVVNCEKHPNADKLHVCTIDDGGITPDVKRGKDGLVQVVCGAPNVRAGMLVAWLPPGTVVPSTYGKDPFKLEPRELRGVVSNGMLASPAELGIGNDHNGLLEIEDAKLGQSFAKVYGLDDQLIDIENKMFTHRPDCFGILGVAREVAGIQAKKFISPSWYLNEPKFEAGSGALKLEVTNELTDLVPRFMAVAISDVKVGPSPAKLQSYLTKVGIKPINNIVDITNYVMYLTGQPLHAYDYDKVKGLSGSIPKLFIRHPKKDEKLKLLGGKIIEPTDKAIMIATDKVAIGVGGVIGGADTEVDENTKNIILECANFDMYSIRRTSMAHGLFTDAVTRFTKGQSPLQNGRVISYAIGQIIEHASGQQASKVIESYDAKSDHNQALHIDSEFVNKRLGLSLTPEKIVDLLHNVEFAAEITRGSVLVVRPPFWRTDVHIQEDIVEEVGRLYGYDHVPLELPKRTMSPVGPDDMLKTKQNIRSKLASLGANEVLTYSFVHGKLIEAASQDAEVAYKVKNALSPDLQYYRLSLLPSLLEKIHPNIKQGHDEFALFEIGKVHGKSEADENGLPHELGRVGLVVASKATSADYFLAKHYLEKLYPAGSIFNYKRFDEGRLEKHKMALQMLAPYDESRSAAVYINDKLAGVVGEFNQKISNKLKLPTNTAGFELFLSSFKPAEASVYVPISKFPGTSQDICLRTKFDLTYEEISSELAKSLNNNKPDDLEFSLKCIDIFAKDDQHRQTTFRMSLVSYQRTLTNEVVNLLLETVSKDLKKSIQADRI